MTFDYSKLKQAILGVFGSYDNFAKLSQIPTKRLMELLEGSRTWEMKDMDAVMKWFPDYRIKEFFFTEVQ